MGKLYVAGIGPGNEDGMTVKVRRILDECPVIVGYKTYIELVRPILGEDKKYVDTGMRREKERCRMALQEASAADAKVCMICSGDASVYGMAGLVLEMAEEYPPVTVEVIPGVTAALSGSAVLGAAVGHDCALISLSDLLTPREVIDKRLSTAADGDFVICLYNPESRTRKGYLKHACEIILNYRDSGKGGQRQVPWSFYWPGRGLRHTGDAALLGLSSRCPGDSGRRGHPFSRAHRYGGAHALPVPHVHRRGPDHAPRDVCAYGRAYAFTHPGAHGHPGAHARGPLRGPVPGQVHRGRGADRDLLPKPGPGHLPL